MINNGFFVISHFNIITGEGVIEQQKDLTLYLTFFSRAHIIARNSRMHKAYIHLSAICKNNVT